MSVGEQLSVVLGSTLLFCLLLYAAPPGLVFGDAVELTYGIIGDQVVHPPGYPLYLVLGRSLLAISPFGGPLTANVLSAFFGTLSLAVFYLFLRRRHLSASSGGLAVLVLVVAFPVWDLYVKAEVYSLAAFLFVTALFFWDLVHRSGRGRLMLWLVAGLSLTHHPLGVLNLLLAAHATWKTLPSFRPAEALVLVLPLGLYGTLLYSGEAMPFNWPEIQSASELYTHILGGSFSRFFLVDGVVTPVVQLGRMLAAHFLVFPVLLLIPLGAGYASLDDELFFLFLLQVMLLVGLSLYGVPDIQDFLLPSYFLAATALARGFELHRPRAVAGAMDGVLFIVVSYGLLVWVAGAAPRYFWGDYDYPRRYAGSVRALNPSGTMLSDWSHYSVLRYYQNRRGWYPRLHLLSPTHRFERWPEIVAFHKRRGVDVYTTIDSWNPPDVIEMNQRGPIFSLRHGSHE